MSEGQPYPAQRDVEQPHPSQTQAAEPRASGDRSYAIFRKITPKEAANLPSAAELFLRIGTREGGHAEDAIKAAGERAANDAPVPAEQFQMPTFAATLEKRFVVKTPRKKVNVSWSFD